MPKAIEYSDALADYICEKIAQGSNINKLDLNKELPAGHTKIYQWLLEHKYFADKYARAREARADVRSDRLDDLKERVLRGEIDPERAKFAADVEKWQAGNESPKYRKKNDDDQKTQAVTINLVNFSHLEQLDSPIIEGEYTHG